MNTIASNIFITIVIKIAILKISVGFKDQSLGLGLIGGRLQLGLSV